MFGLDDPCEITGPQLGDEIELLNAGFTPVSLDTFYLKLLNLSERGKERTKAGAERGCK